MSSMLLVARLKATTNNDSLKIKTQNGLQWIEAESSREPSQSHSPPPLPSCLNEAVVPPLSRLHVMCQSSCQMICHVPLAASLATVQTWALASHW